MKYERGFFMGRRFIPQPCGWEAIKVPGSHINFVFHGVETFGFKGILPAEWHTGLGLTRLHFRRFAPYGCVPLKEFSTIRMVLFVRLGIT